MRSLDLFTGYGGMTLALEGYAKPIAYVEIEEYAQKVIAYRMAEGSLPRAPILADVKNVYGEPGVCDIIVGGFPCQDVSVAGARKGLAGQRSGLFFEIVRLTKEISPNFVFLENVPGIRTRGLREVITEFTKIGYDCRWTCVSASSLGAPHKRERWFMLAHSHGENLRHKPDCIKRCEGSSEPRNNGKKEPVADSNGNGPQGRVWPRGNKEKVTTITDNHWWAAQPSICRVAYGTPFRLDRAKMLGNGVVPQQARFAFEKLVGL